MARASGEDLSLVNAHGKAIEKVLVAVPCGDHVDAGFALDLANLYAHTTKARPDTELALYFLRGTYVTRARAGLAQLAIATAATHIFWLDADMRFPKDALIRLLTHERPIVAANYPTRKPPIIPTAINGAGKEIFVHDGTELVDVQQCGMGCMLTATQVFLDMGKPWFALGYSPASDDYSGEDMYFCQKARKHGHRLWIDPVLSEEMRHTGAMDFTMDHARTTLVAAAEQAGG